MMGIAHDFADIQPRLTALIASTTSPALKQLDLGHLPVAEDKDGRAYHLSEVQKACIARGIELDFGRCSDICDECFEALLDCECPCDECGEREDECICALTTCKTCGHPCYGCECNPCRTCGRGDVDCHCGEELYLDQPDSPSMYDF